MSSVENVEIFEDTKRLCETNGKIKEALAQVGEKPETHSGRRGAVSCG